LEFISQFKANYIALAGSFNILLNEAFLVSPFTQSILTSNTDS